VIKQYKDIRIKLFSQRRLGVSIARNRGVQETSTNIIAFIDADDEWKPEYLETVFRLFTEYPQAGAYATAYEKRVQNHIVKHKNQYKEIPQNTHGIITNYLEICIKYPILSSSSLAVKKDCFIEIGGFPEGVQAGEDFALWVMIGLKHQIAFCNSPLAIYHRDTANSLTKINRSKFESYLIEYLTSLIDTDWIDVSKRNLLIKICVFMYLELAYIYIYDGESKKALSTLRECYGQYKKIPTTLMHKWLFYLFLSLSPSILFKVLRRAKVLMVELLSLRRKVG
jgi:glycosyltransferase involved in cell wall biosynthesis